MSPERLYKRKFTSQKTRARAIVMHNTIRSSYHLFSLIMKETNKSRLRWINVILFVCIKTQTSIENASDHWSPNLNYRLQKLSLISRMADNCITCTRPVTSRQQATQCDVCLQWNHRTCNTGKLPFILHFQSVCKTPFDLWGDVRYFATRNRSVAA